MRVPIPLIFASVAIVAGVLVLYIKISIPPSMGVAWTVYSASGASGTASKLPNNYYFAGIYYSGTVQLGSATWYNKVTWGSSNTYPGLLPVAVYYNATPVQGLYTLGTNWGIYVYNTTLVFLVNRRTTATGSYVADYIPFKLVPYGSLYVVYPLTSADIALSSLCAYTGGNQYGSLDYDVQTIGDSAGYVCSLASTSSVGASYTSTTSTAITGVAYRFKYGVIYMGTPFFANSQISVSWNP